MQPYKELIHGGDLATYRSLFAGREVLDFSVNVNPLGMPASVQAAVADCAAQAANYPDPQCRELRAAIAAFESWPADRILCGAGAAELIFRIAYALRPARALVLCPTFAEYALALGQVGCHCTHHRLDADRDFRVDGRLADAVRGQDLVFLCNPNNPNGLLLDPAIMREVVAACAAAGAVLVVDECFIDFVDNPEAHTVKGLLERYPTLVVLRAFTKIFAMAGLRLGYALCADAALLRRIDEAGPAWNVGVPAQVAGVAAAGEQAFVRQTRALVARERPRLARALADCGLRVFPSDANYLLLRGGDEGLSLRLCERGILVRDCANVRGLGAGYLRVAVRGEEENKVLLRTMKESIQCATS